VRDGIFVDFAIIYLKMSSGWGRLYDNKKSPISDVLMETKLFLKTPNVCKKMTRLAGYDDDSMICAYIKNSDACVGDSGIKNMMITISEWHEN
jgi:hypothetical protein